MTDSKETKAQLQEKLEQEGIKMRGTKEQLQDRLVETEKEKLSLARERLQQLQEQDREPLVSNWRGVVRYACPFEGCPFDTTSLPVITEHILVVHPAPSVEDVAAMEAFIESNRLPDEEPVSPETEFDPDFHKVTDPNVTGETKDREDKG